MNENPNSHNNESANKTDNAWDNIAENPTSQSTNTPEGQADTHSSEKLSKLEQKLEDLRKRIKETKEKHNGNAPDDMTDSLMEEYARIQHDIKIAKTEETIALLPESQREAFKEWVEDEDSSSYLFDEIVDAIHRYDGGESLDVIKTEITSKDRNGATEENNQKRGEVVYNKLVGFLGVDETSNE